MRISKHSFRTQIMIDQKQLENVEDFNSLTIMIDDIRYTREIKSGIAMVKSAFNRRRLFFSSELELNLKKKSANCYILSMTLCGAEIWILRKVEQKYLVSFEMWCWIRMEKISWTQGRIKLFGAPRQ